jgi:hypothetical protein
MDSIKYLASYHGPSYGSMDQVHMDSFQSLANAMVSMANRQKYEADTLFTYEEDSAGVYRPCPESFDRHTQFPSTTREDFMDVYHALPSDELDGKGGYILGEWAYRISVGPRGGIRVEKA